MRAAEGKLPFMNTMRQLYASESSLCIRKGLEAQHRSAPPFDRAMVLLNNVVQIAPRAHYNALPSWIFLTQQAHCPVACGITVQIDFAWPGRGMRDDRLAEERLCRLPAAVGAKQMVDGFAVSIDGPIQVVRSASDGDVCFVHTPGRIHRLRVASPPLLILWDIPKHPAHDRRMSHGNAALGHHGSQIPVTEPVGDVPAHAQLDDVHGEPTPTEEGVARDCTGHAGLALLGFDAVLFRQCTRTHSYPHRALAIPRQ